MQNLLYQAIQEQINDDLPWWWGCELRGRLFTLVAGIMLSESSSPRQIASALHRHSSTDVLEASLERQVRRIQNDERLQAETCLHPYAKRYLQESSPTELILILDATTHTDRYVMLMVSARYRGRALPLAWQLWPANVPLEGKGFWDRVADLLATVAPLLPPVPILWLADRAFGTPRFTDMIAAYGWHFVVRVQGQTRYRNRVGQESRIDALPCRRNRTKCQGQVFKSAGWRTLSVVVLRRHSYPGPLCLVSNLPAEWSLAHCYRFRYNIEAMFRDLKSSGWRWEDSQVTHMGHVQRLMLGMALATWLTLQAGTQVAEEWLAKPTTGTRTTPPPISHVSLFQLGLKRVQEWAVGNTRRCLSFRLLRWNAPNWRDEITQHHQHAFIMGSSSLVKVQSYLYSSVRP